MSEESVAVPTNDVSMTFHVSLDEMLIGDLETLERPASNKDLIDTLQRLIPGADIRKLPIRLLPIIGRRVREELAGMQIAKN